MEEKEKVQTEMWKTVSFPVSHRIRKSGLPLLTFHFAVSLLAEKPLLFIHRTFVEHRLNIIRPHLRYAKDRSVFRIMRERAQT